jgi:hypothetical protein
LSLEDISKLRAIQTLRGGVVSRETVRLITVGSEGIEGKLSQSLRKLKSGNLKKELILITADWGFGKSHIRMLLSDQLVRMGIPFASDSIDGRASSLSHMHRAVWRWLEGMQIGRFHGLRAAVRQGSIDSDLLKEWCVQRKRSKFADGIRWVLCGGEYGWLTAMGHLYRTPDYGYQHDKALRCLLDCADMLAATGKGGIVLLLDEAENIDKQYNIRGRRKSYETIQIFIQHPHILPVLFVTDRFIRLIEEDRMQGVRDTWRTCQILAQSFLREFSGWSHLTPPVFDDTLATTLVDKIIEIYTSVYKKTDSKFSGAKVVEFWKRTTNRSPRLLVRLLINELDLCCGQELKVRSHHDQQFIKRPSDSGAFETRIRMPL